MFFQTEMEALMDDLLQMGEPRSTSVHVVDSVLSQNSSHSSQHFLKNVGIKTPVSNKSATPNENELRDQLAAEARAAVQGELEELKQKSEDADQRLLKTQNELEEYKKLTEQNIKEMEENRILIRQLLRIHGPSSSGSPST
jgi:molecular chaperone GrpE (heat shock protein)